MGESAASPRQVGGREAFISGAAYGMLFTLGLVLGVIGAFHHAWYLANLPVGAVVLAGMLFLSCRVAGWLMATRVGALLPGVGWLLASVPLATARREGDYVIALFLADVLYLLGAAGAVVIAVALTPTPRPVSAPPPSIVRTVGDSN